MVLVEGAEVLLDLFLRGALPERRDERVGPQLVDRDAPDRSEIPQLVAQDRAADGRVDVVDVRDALRRFEPELVQGRGQVLGLPPAVGEADVVRPAEVVPAVLGDHVQPQPARRDLRRAARGADRHLLAQRLVVVVHDPAVAQLGVDHHAVDLHDGVVGVGAVRDHLHLLHHLGAADVRDGQAHPLRQVADRLRVARRRQRVDGVALQDLGPRRALHVHHRGFTRDRDGLLERPDRQRAVDRHREVRLQLQAFLHEGREARQAHRDGVGAGAQVDDGVAAGAVGDRDTAPLDQCRTGDFHGDAGQDAPGVVADLAGDRALGERRGSQGQDDERGQRAARALDDCHLSSSWMRLRERRYLRHERLPSRRAVDERRKATTTTTDEFGRRRTPRRTMRYRAKRST